ncbi:MAG: protein adenylyltransferase SelO family protein [Thiolinea sp.]
MPGAVLTRLSRSYVRFQAFQFFAARENLPALQVLTDCVIARNFPELEGPSNWLALLEAVIERWRNRLRSGCTSVSFMA